MRDSFGLTGLTFGELGFLLVVVGVFVMLPGVADPDIEIEPGPSPPPGVVELEQEFGDLPNSGSFEVRTTFSTLNITYTSALLFVQCDWTLSSDGRDLLESHARVLWQHEEQITRLQIEGHADSRPADGCASLSELGELKPTNWLLSSLRAMRVREVLADLALEHPEGNVDTRLRILEAVGRGDLHPIEQDNPAADVNRRLEITVHFRELSS